MKTPDRAERPTPTGPVSADAKRKVSQNALSHGLTARNLDVLIPNDAERQRRLDLWVAKFQPEGPEEMALVRDAVLAERQLEVVAEVERSVINEQLRVIPQNWGDDRLDRVEELVNALFDEDADRSPARVIREMAKLAQGARWMRDAWAEIRNVFRTHGSLYTMGVIYRMLRISGHDPNRLVHSVSPDGYALLLAACSGIDTTGWPDMEALITLELAKPPFAWCALNGNDRIDPEEAKRWLGERIESMVLDWETRVEIAEDHEAAERANAEARAMLIHDTPANKLMLRYQSAARSALHRAIAGLQKSAKLREQAAEAEAKRNNDKANRTPPLDAEVGASYVNIDGSLFKAEPIGEGVFQMTSSSRKGPGVVCRSGVVCRPAETGPDAGV